MMGNLVLRRSETAVTETEMPPSTAAAPTYSRSNPFPGKLLVNRRLSGPESRKDTRHFEIDLTGWGLSFEVGDSVAVYPSNDPDLVEEIVHLLGAKGDELVPAAKTQKSLREALLRNYSITQPTPKFLKAITERANSSTLLKDLLQPGRREDLEDRKSTRLNSSHTVISYAVFCLKKKKKTNK